MKTLKKITTFLIVLIIGLSNIPLGTAQETYHLAVGQDYMPFRFQGEDGQQTGIDVKILEAVAQDQGFEYHESSYNFSALLQAIEAGQVDAGMAAISVTDERKQVIDFTDPYFEAGSSFAVRSDSDIEDLEELKGLTVATKTGSMGEKIASDLQDQYGYEINRFDESANMYEDVAAGNSDALIEDKAVIAYAIASGIHDLKLIGPELEISQMAVATKKGTQPEFIALFNQGLQNIKENGTYDAIIEEFLGQDALKKVEVDTSFMGQLQKYWPDLLKGLWQTILISLISIAIAFVLGSLLGIARVIPNKVIAFIARTYVDIIRGIPMMVLAFFIYFGIPQMTGIELSAFAAGILTLSLNATAYIGEIVRGGIQAIDVGQGEAGRSLGLDYGATLRKIILPQAFKIMVPSFINQFIITLKDSSILSAIGLIELTQTGRIIIARTFQSGNIWIIVALMYIILINILIRISEGINKRI